MTNLARQTLCEVIQLYYIFCGIKCIDSAVLYAFTEKWINRIVKHEVIDRTQLVLVR